MKRRLTRPLALGAVGVLAVAGGGIAYAATSAGNPRDALLDDAAQRLNVSPDKLRSALQGAFGDQLDQAVKAGKLTQQQADQIKQRMQQRGGLPPLGGGPHVMRFGFGPGRGPRAGLKAAADYLGLTPAKLRQELQGGKSLADVAKATSGMSVSGLEDAILAQITKDVNANTKLTADQKTQILADAKTKVDAMVNAAPGADRHGGMHMQGGFRGGPMMGGSVPIYR